MATLEFGGVSDVLMSCCKSAEMGGTPRTNWFMNQRNKFDVFGMLGVRRLMHPERPHVGKLSTTHRAIIDKVVTYILVFGIGQ